MNEYDEIFSRGVATFIDPEGIFRKKVEAKALGAYEGEVVIKFGVDPTRPDIHLGHAVVLRKLRTLQDLGCKVIFLIGDYTSQIGDPTGKSKVRPEISQQEIEANMKTYLEQVGKILRTDESVFSWIRNSEWFLDVTDLTADEAAVVTINDIENKNSVSVSANSFIGKAALFESSRMQKTHLGRSNISTVSFSRVLSTLRHVTHARLIERDMFQDRITGGTELYMHEMLYPVIQGIDSAILAGIYGSCDLEIGGSDQTFNMLMGRDVMKMNGQEMQAVMSMEIIEGLDGKEKMSKSLDNYVSITDEAADMYGKIMSIPDSVIGRYFLLATYTPVDEVKKIEQDLENNKIHPKEIKMRLAKEIVAIYHGDAAAQEAEDAFDNTFAKGKIPEDVPEIAMSEGTIVDALITAVCAESKSEARRLIEQGAVTHLESDEKITDTATAIQKGTYRVGKHRFFKVM